jgi:hypothetical protein
MRKAYLFIVAVGFLLSSSLTFAQDGFFADWFNMVSGTQAEQPHWVTPLNRRLLVSNRSFGMTFSGRLTIAASPH